MSCRPLFDAIIVGAGSAGSVLAHRLSQAQPGGRRLRVLLLEAGGKDRPWLRVPVSYYKTQMNPAFDWCFESEPVPGLGGRSLQVPRGRVLGGSSSVNGMLWVRGQARDYDSWAEALGGDARWSAASCLPRFEALETQLEVGPPRCDMIHTDEGMRAFVTAAGEAGIGGGDAATMTMFPGALRGAEPGASAEQEGAGMLPVTVSPRGLRASASAAFLRPAIEDAGSLLDVILGATVDRLRLENNCGDRERQRGTERQPHIARCTGVEFTDEHEVRQVATLAPGGEVVVCCGAIGSPHLLLRSGIGDGHLLERGGISTVYCHLPAVGQHLQDHCQVKAAFRTRVPTLNCRVNSWSGLAAMVARFALTRRGPLTMAPTPAGAFARITCDDAAPTTQLLYGPWTSRSRTMAPLQLFRLLDPFPAAALTAIALRPTSRGSVTLGGSASNNHGHSAPQIQLNFLGTPEDEQAAVDSVRLMLRVALAPAMRRVVDMHSEVESESRSMTAAAACAADQGTEGGGEGGDTFASLLRVAVAAGGGPQGIDDGRLLRFARANGTSVYHPVGTCRMGMHPLSSDIARASETGSGGAGGSVVNGDLRVHGVEGLSVADASVMPSIVSGNTNAASMMIGDHAGGLVTARLATHRLTGGGQRWATRMGHRRRAYGTMSHTAHANDVGGRGRRWSAQSLSGALPCTGSKPSGAASFGSTATRRSAALSVSLGFDFGTESVRAVLCDTETGDVVGSGTSAYAHGVITGSIDASLAGAAGGAVPLNSHDVLQNSADWVDAAAMACGAAMDEARRTADGFAGPESVVGIGSCFTACTVLPCRADGAPLHTMDAFRTRPQAWPKMWKHQAAAEAHLLTEHARTAAAEAEDCSGHARGGDWLQSRYGGAIGAEWLHPKALEVHDRDPEVFAAADVFVEAGDWFVFQLVHGSSVGVCGAAPSVVMEDVLARSTCQAGFKGCWRGVEDGFPEAALWDGARAGFGSALAGKFECVGRVFSPGVAAGGLGAEAAARFGLLAGTPVSTTSIDAHTGVPGVGVAVAGTLVMVMGTSGCYMLNAAADSAVLPGGVPGCLGRVEDGIVPGLVGLEMGQSAMGDLFAWAARLTNTPVRDLAAAAKDMATAGAGREAGRRRPLALDWFNGCRSPHNDGSLMGSIAQLDLGTMPGDLYLGIAEGLACGARHMVRDFASGGAPVHRLVATGGLPHVAPLLLQTFADALQRPITVSEQLQSTSIGAAVFGAVAGGAHGTVEEAVAAMAAPGLNRGRVVEPGGVGGAVADYWAEVDERYVELAAMELRLAELRRE